MEESYINLCMQNGKILSKAQNEIECINDLHNAEFKVFSQFGDDGIIQFLVNYLDIDNEIFVEFGVGDYKESNTLFLLMNNNWSGLIMDSSNKNTEKIKGYNFYWKYDLRVKTAFVTIANINGLIEEEGIQGEIGLLHIDIDGNDFWIWKAINIIDPVIVVIEYNSIFGSDRHISIPYDPEFNRTNSHFSNLYAGSSLASLCDLAAKKDYSFVASNSAGNNAYFVKNKYLKSLKSLSPKTGYVMSKFRESRDQKGNLTYLRSTNRIEAIKGLEVINTKTNQTEKL